jgi:ZIP family zinc transporter/zinc and cadmium transporter
MSRNITIVYILLAFGLAVGGGSLGASLARSHRRLCVLISIGAGTLLGVTAFDIVPETFEALNWWGLLLAFGSGYGVFALITRYVFHVCPACAASHFDEATTHRFSEIATGMMIALALHCTADGIAIAAGHEAELAQVPGGRALAFSLVIAVCVHKIPEGLALGSLLLGAGFRPRATLLRVAGVEATTLLGGLAGLLFLGRIPQIWLAAIVAHAGGGFLFLALHAVFGEIFRNHKPLVLISFASGFSLIGAVTWFLRLM